VSGVVVGVVDVVSGVVVGVVAASAFFLSFTATTTDTEIIAPRNRKIINGIKKNIYLCIFAYL
jgi:MFS superfamily sulfate permease-like transporter